LKLMRIRALLPFRRYPVSVFIVIVLLSGLILISLRVRQRQDVTFLDALLLEVCSPFQKAATQTLEAVQGAFRKYVFLIHTQKENEMLKRRIAELQGENHQTKEMAIANERFRRLLQFRDTLVTRTLAAEVIGQDASSWFKSVSLNKGERDGVQRGMAVIAPEGVVGQVLKTSSSYSTVLLITDYNSAIDAIVQRTRAKAIVEGKEENRCQLKYLLRTEDVAVGDVVVTSGLGNFPKGLLVGEIQDIEKKGYGVFQYAELIPGVDLTRLEEVLIITESSTVSLPPQEEKGEKAKKASGGGRKKK